MNSDFEIEDQPSQEILDNENIDLGSSSFDDYNTEYKLGRSSSSASNVIALEGLRILVR
jgi:hypothetical protein